MSDERLLCIVVPAAMALVCAIGLVVGALVATHLVRTSEPWCPTEDSCVATYQSGGWRVVEVTP